MTASAGPGAHTLGLALISGGVRGAGVAVAPTGPEPVATGHATRTAPSPGPVADGGGDRDEPAATPSTPGPYGARAH
ncbi:hypothetical protein GCM10010517_78950 [Streptosporangium fragile]|uniref:Uncharacterized protein n=1 Tax=Streptosporangium fragile TaxID=46186 RepID=A0ABP6IWN9_9ACTN